MTAEIKLCRNCKYYKGGWFRPQECWHPKNILIDLINGFERTNFTPSELRLPTIHCYWGCGKEGKWYVEKKK